jgi:transaldolase
MLEMARKPWVAGLTTNPTLMRKAGIADYRAFAKDILQAIPDKPISFEVFSDDCLEMERQANEIASWGDNVYVKIPVTNTCSESCCPLVKRLAKAGVKQNVHGPDDPPPGARGVGGPRRRAEQLRVGLRRAHRRHRPRPDPADDEAVRVLRDFPRQELIWASPRELLNVFQADEIGCHIITVTNDVLKKLSLVGKDLDGVQPGDGEDVPRRRRSPPGSRSTSSRSRRSR